MNLKINSPISVEKYFDNSQVALRRVNTNIFYYLLFFTIGLILIIVAACIYGQGVNYGYQLVKGAKVDLGVNHQDSTTVLNNASTSLFIVGGLFIGFPIFINIYAIQKINKVQILKNNVPKYIIMLLISGIILQITAFIGMILLYPKLKSIYSTYKNK